MIRIHPQCPPSHLCSIILVGNHLVLDNSGSPNSFLCTVKDYGDFELDFEQIEIEASGAKGAEAGYVYGEAMGQGWLTPEKRVIPHKHFKDGAWNQYRIVAKGARIRIWINGRPIEDLRDEEVYKAHALGFIGLQVHGVAKGSGPYEVAWRNIRIKSLD